MPETLKLVVEAYVNREATDVDVATSQFTVGEVEAEATPLAKVTKPFAELKFPPNPPRVESIAVPFQIPEVIVPTVARLGADVKVPMVEVALILASARALVK